LEFILLSSCTQQFGGLIVYRGNLPKKDHPMRFNHAILRTPCVNFARGITSANMGKPSFEKALEQHQTYANALVRCGLELTVLPAEEGYPDSTFVEDVAVLTDRGAILTNPGAASRNGEAALIKPVLEKFFPDLYFITAPGTLDGGDVCQADDHFFIGISERTNKHGANQLKEILENLGYFATLVDIRPLPGMLHLKSALAYLGEGHMLLAEPLQHIGVFGDYQVLEVAAGELYAANCIRVNDFILMAAGYPHLRQKVENLGYALIALEMSEFQKMDGGLSCLSLRFWQ
jgi:dimethylargininase